MKQETTGKIIGFVFYYTLYGWFRTIQHGIDCMYFSVFLSFFLNKWHLFFSNIFYDQSESLYNFKTQYFLDKNLSYCPFKNHISYFYLCFTGRQSISTDLQQDMKKKTQSKCILSVYSYSNTRR